MEHAEDAAHGARRELILARAHLRAELPNKLPNLLRPNVGEQKRTDSIKNVALETRRLVVDAPDAPCAPLLEPFQRVTLDRGRTEDVLAQLLARADLPLDLIEHGFSLLFS